MGKVINMNVRNAKMTYIVKWREYFFKGLKANAKKTLYIFKDLIANAKNKKKATVMFGGFRRAWCHSSLPPSLVIFVRHLLPPPLPSPLAVSPPEMARHLLSTPLLRTITLLPLLLRVRSLRFRSRFPPSTSPHLVVSSPSTHRSDPPPPPRDLAV